jgi:hypothetical protein
MAWTLAAALMGAPIRAQDPAPRTDRVDAALARAVSCLASLQDREGAIHERHLTPHLTAMTSLSILAMLAVGHQPADPTPEGAALSRALAYVLRPAAQDSNGYFGGPDGSRMYGHGICTLMLCEMLGMGMDEAQDLLIRDRARKALDLILRSQQVRKDPRHQGGWRYEPGSTDSDLSVTVWQLLALRAARNAGLSVPQRSIDQAVEYVKRCYHSKRRPDGSPENAKSACGYEVGNPPGYAMAAAGLLSLQVCGQYDAPEVAGSADWLKGRKTSYDSEWFFYGTYYYAQGMYQRGEPYGSAARREVEETLLARQARDGSWTARGGIERGMGKTYATSLAVLSLAVKHHYLPIYQR